MKKYYIKTAKTYKDKEGKEKRIFRAVGEIIDWGDKGLSFELYAQPETRFYVYSDIPSTPKTPEAEKKIPDHYSDPSYNPEEVPF